MALLQARVAAAGAVANLAQLRLSLLEAEPGNRSQCSSLSMHVQPLAARVAQIGFGWMPPGLGHEPQEMPLFPQIVP